MRILGIYLENIRSYKQGLVVFPPRGITVIHGDIGSGKTSLLMSIVFALFGPRREGGGLFEAYKIPTMRDLLRVGSARGRVRILIQIGERLYLIERTLRLDNTSLSQDSGSVEEFLIENGVLKSVRRMNEVKSSELNKIVLDILGLQEKRRYTQTTSPMVFPTAIYVPQFMVQEVLEQKESERLEIIERVLGLDRYKLFKLNYESVIQQLKLRIDGLSSRIESKNLLIKNTNVALLEEEIKNLTQELARLEAEIGELSKEQERLQKLIDNTKGEIDRMKLEKENIQRKLREYEDKKRELKDLEEKISKIIGSQIIDEDTVKNYRETLEDAIRRLRSEQEQVASQIQTLSNMLQIVESDRRIIEEDRSKLSQELASNRSKYEHVQRELDKLRRQLDEVKTLVSQGKCPVCRQPIPHEHGSKLIKELEEACIRMEDELKSTERLIAEIKTKLKEIEEKLNKARETEQELRRQINDLLRRQDYLSRKINEHQETRSTIIGLIEKWSLLFRELSSVDTQRLANEIKNIDENIRIRQQELESLKASYDLLLSRIRELDRKAGSVKGLIEEKKRRIEDVRKIIDEMNKERQELDQLKRVKEELEYSYKVVERVEKEIMRILANEFRVYFTNIIQELMPDQPLEIVVTDNFSLEEKIKLGRLSYPVRSLSGGQNIAISLAYRLALNLIVRSRSKTLRKGTLLLDEPTIGFSRELVERLRDLLRKISSGEGRREGQVIVVTHDETLIEAGDCRIKLTIDTTEHQTRISYDECELDPDYKKLVEDLLRGSHRIRSGDIVVSIGSFEPIIQPARKSLHE